MCSSVDAGGGGGEAAEVAGAMESIAAADAAAPNDVSRGDCAAWFARVRNGWLAVVQRTKWTRRRCAAVLRAGGGGGGKANVCL